MWAIGPQFVTCKSLLRVQGWHDDVEAAASCEVLDVLLLLPLYKQQATSKQLDNIAADE